MVWRLVLANARFSILLTNLSIWTTSKPLYSKADWRIVRTERGKVISLSELQNEKNKAKAEAVAKKKAELLAAQEAAAKAELEAENAEAAEETPAAE